MCLGADVHHCAIGEDEVDIAFENKGLIVVECAIDNIPSLLSFHAKCGFIASERKSIGGVNCAVAIYVVDFVSGQMS